MIEEIDRRMLWASLGYASMFALCVERFGMSESMAGKRIGVARLARRFPVIFERVGRGELFVSGVLCLKPYLDEDNHVRVLEAARGKSRRAIEKLVAELFPRQDVASTLRALPRSSLSKGVEAPALVASASDSPPRELTDGPVRTPLPAPKPWRAPTDGPVKTTSPTPRPARAPDPAPLAPRRYKLTVTIDEETHGELAQLQDLLAHQIPDGDPAAIVKKAFSLLLGETLKKKAAITDAPRAGRTRAKKRTRAIPAAIRRAVWKRDGGKCTFVGEGGKVCGATRKLEYAHLEPWGMGGEHAVETMALRCRGHNAYEAVRDYGAPLIERKRRERGVREQAAVYGRAPADSCPPRTVVLSPGKAAPPTRFRFAPRSPPDEKERPTVRRPGVGRAHAHDVHRSPP